MLPERPFPFHHLKKEGFKGEVRSSGGVTDSVGERVTVDLLHKFGEAFLVTEKIGSRDRSSITFSGFPIDEVPIPPEWMIRLGGVEDLD